MNMRRFVLLLAATLSLMSPGDALCSAPATQSTAWGWFAALSTPSSWWIVRGMGTLILRGEKFSAELRSEDGSLLISLSGTIEQGAVHAVAIRHETGDNPRKLAGTRKVVKLSNIRSTRDTVLLFEPGQPGGLTIGITRDTSGE